MKKKYDAVKFDKEKSEAIIDLLEEMCNQSEAERVASMIKLILIMADSGSEHVVGKYQRIDKETKRMNQIQTYVICNAKRDITLDDVARYVHLRPLMQPKKVRYTCRHTSPVAYMNRVNPTAYFSCLILMLIKTRLCKFTIFRIK